MKYTVCQTKVHFDTEFEAERAASITSSNYGSEMMSYQCGPHWHITHVNPDERQGAGYRFKKCEDCGEIYKKTKRFKHRCEEKE